MHFILVIHPKFGLFNIINRGYFVSQGERMMESNVRAYIIPVGVSRKE